jgi:hypothetical protein
MHSLKLNVGSTWYLLQDKLDEVRQADEAAKPALVEARANLEKWVKERKAEAKGTIDQWIENRQAQKLAARAQEAEDCAGIAIMIAQASIDDVERMILEAISARRDADAVKNGGNAEVAAHTGRELPG